MTDLSEVREKFEHWAKENTDDHRSEFEAWVGTFGLPLSRDSTGKYTDYTAHRMWMVWRFRQGETEELRANLRWWTHDRYKDLQGIIDKKNGTIEKLNKTILRQEEQIRELNGEQLRQKELNEQRDRLTEPEKQLDADFEQLANNTIESSQAEVSRLRDANAKLQIECGDLLATASDQFDRLEEMEEYQKENAELKTELERIKAEWATMADRPAPSGFQDATPLTTAIIEDHFRVPCDYLGWHLRGKLHVTITENYKGEVFAKVDDGKMRIYTVGQFRHLASGVGATLNDTAVVSGPNPAEKESDDLVITLEWLNSIGEFSRSAPGRWTGWVGTVLLDWNDAFGCGYCLNVRDRSIAWQPCTFRGQLWRLAFGEDAGAVPNDPAEVPKPKPTRPELWWH